MEKAERAALRDKATELMAQAEMMLNKLVESYDKNDGSFSACHPCAGMSSTVGQLYKLRRALEKARV